MSAGFLVQQVHNIVTATNILNNYKGILVTSAGNSGKNMDISFPVFPAAVECNNIVSVGASTGNDELWIDSNYGTSTVDIFAPGHEIFDIGTEFDAEGNHISSWDSGTSYSTPMVAGVAALMKYVNPNLTPLQIKAILMNTVDRKDVFIGKCVSGGRLNALEAVKVAYDMSTDNPSAENVAKSDLLFHASTNTIIKGLDTCEDVTVPATINGVPVEITTENESATIEMLHEIEGRGTEYVIPERIGSIPVETIGNSAFENTGATSVVIPESVTYLEYDSFSGCTNLTAVYFYNADTEISIPVFSSGIYNQLTIYGMEDSTAEIYADLLGINFVCIT